MSNKAKVVMTVLSKVCFLKYVKIKCTVCCKTDVKEKQMKSFCCSVLCSPPKPQFFQFLAWQTLAAIYAPTASNLQGSPCPAGLGIYSGKCFYLPSQGYFVSLLHRKEAAKRFPVCQCQFTYSKM